MDTINDAGIIAAYESAISHARQKPHPTVVVQVWADIDILVAPLVRYLNTIPGVRTDASCQGTIGEGGPHPYRAYVMASWPEEVDAMLREQFDVEYLGTLWGYIRPREMAGELDRAPVVTSSGDAS